MAALANLPTDLIRRELSRRDDGDKPSCGSRGPPRSYNTSLHVFALFLILLLSTLACSFPLIVRRFPNLPVPNYSLFLSRHFGTGVLIATAFVHLLPTAYVSLTDPCLPSFWNEVYPPMSGFIAMVSVMVVVGIEMFFATKGASHSHSLDLEHLRSTKHEHDGLHSVDTVPRKPHAERGLGLEFQSPALASSRRSPYSDTPGSTDKPLPPSPPRRRSDDSADAESDLDLDELDTDADDTRLLNRETAQEHRSDANVRPDVSSRGVSFAVPDSAIKTATKDDRLVLQCLLLEAGILFHSVFIGMALSVSTGSAFIVLLIAISFHQTFEGLALGSRIAAIPSFSTTSFKPWLMSVMYGVTTPIGQAIGLAVHRLYDPASQLGLLMVGIVNAISSGLLLYAGLVQLLSVDFLSDQSYIELQGRRRLEASAAVVCGSMLMAFVGCVDLVQFVHRTLTDISVLPAVLLRDHFSLDFGTTTVTYGHDLRRHNTVASSS